MQIVSDLHLHSKYSRAVSRDMELATMAMWGRKKGIDLLTTGDWTHPLWLREIQSQLVETSEGIYQLKNGKVEDGKSKVERNEPKFLLTVEIASIYSQGGRVRRIHNLLFSPNIETCVKVNQELVNRGCNISSDGRPIVGLTSRDLLEMALSINPKILLIPCHAWTPHFGIYGSASGFDSIEECFGTAKQYIYGIETGISSDPEMNWRVGELEGRSILSFSDAHSPGKMARECTVFEFSKLTFENIRQAIMRPSLNGVAARMVKRKTLDETDTGSESVNPNRVLYTIEFYPEEGKYHYSGHRNCGVVFGPEEIREKGNMCPVCKRRLTEGVLFRVEQLSTSSEDRAREKTNEYGLKWFTDSKKKHPPFVKLVPLLEVCAESLDTSATSIKAKVMFDEVCAQLGSELDVLLKTPTKDIEKAFGPRLADGVERIRRGNIDIHPGYDGEYGKVRIWPSAKQSSSESTQSDKENATGKKTKDQLGLF